MLYERGRQGGGMTQEREDRSGGAQSRFTGGYKREEKLRTLIPFIDKERIGQKTRK